jgi:hypothetical protein
MRGRGGISVNERERLDQLGEAGASKFCCGMLRRGTSPSRPPSRFEAQPGRTIGFSWQETTGSRARPHGGEGLRLATGTLSDPLADHQM